MEDKDDVQRNEFVARHGQSQTDEDGVENDTELENEDRGQLRHVIFDFFLQTRLLVVLARVTQVVFTGDVALGFIVGDRVLVLFLGDFVNMSFANASIAHHHEFHEEQDHHCHQDNTLHPTVLGNGAGETLIRQSLFCRGEQMNEGGRNDDTRTKELGDEEAPFENNGVAQVSGHYRKDGAKGRSEPDDKDGRDTNTHAAVILVTRITSTGPGGDRVQEFGHHLAVW